MRQPLKLENNKQYTPLRQTLKLENNKHFLRFGNHNIQSEVKQE